jgi:hypothetical protein
MTFGVFNTESGNLIEAYDDEKSALLLVAEILEDTQNDAESVTLVVSDKGKIVRTVAGDDLRTAVAPYSQSVTA